jgi:FkbM family methyltransferase
VSVLLLAHPWSGVCSIASEPNEPQNLDLFCDSDEGLVREVSVKGTGGVTNFYLKCTGEKNPSSRDHQVWLLGFKLGDRFLPIERGRALTQTVRLIDGDYGRFMALRSDVGVAESLAREGSWGKRDVDLFRKYVPEGGYVFDVGANLGHHSIVFSKLVGPGGKVFSFEPQKMMFCLLCANIAINNTLNVHPYKVGIGEKQGTLHMYPIDYGSDNNFGALGINFQSDTDSQRTAGEEVSIVTIDSFISSIFPFERLDFLKIDVQSFELFVLKGALLSLSRFHPTIFIEISPKWMHRRGYDYKEIYSMLSALGYQFVHSGGLSELRDVPEWDGVSEVEWDLLALAPSKQNR